MGVYDDLITEFGSGSAKQNASPANDYGDLIQEFGSGGVRQPQSRKERLKAEAPQRVNELKAFGQGLLDIVNAGASGIGYVDKNLFTGGEERNADLQKRIKTENENFTANNPPSEGMLPTGPEAARMIGQTAATAPLTPVKGFQAVKGLMGAVPRIAATGEKIAAPFLNKAAASAVTGGLAGSEYGALTSTTNDKSLAENMATGLITGALTAPAAVAAGAVGKGLLPTAKNLWASLDINKVAQQAKMDPAAIKNVVSILENAGFTPQQAQIALNKLGPKATLSDLAQSIQTEASGIASFGDKPTEILKGRFEARAKTANSEAHDLMERNLGPKPNLEAEREGILDKVRKDVAPDYAAAHGSSDVLDIKPIIEKIDKNLETAVGPKAQALKTVKSFLFNRTKDAEGNAVLTPKDSVAHLHEVREAIDDVMDKAKNPTTSIGKRALRSVGDVRGNIDELLKTNPEMASADAKFADKMQILKDIDFGENLLKNNGMNSQEFDRFYSGLTPDRQAAVAKGLHGHIGDLMQQATRGELSEAQRLFGKSSRNRENLVKVFGNKGEEVLDALEKEATFRSTEQKVMHGAQTAERQSVQRKYGERNDGGGLKDIATGAALDIVTGTPGGATAISTLNRMGNSIKLSISSGRKDRLIEGTADLLSRSGAERDTGLGIAARVRAIQDRMKPKRNFSLPAKSAGYIFSAPVGELSFSQYKKANQE